MFKFGRLSSVLALAAVISSPNVNAALDPQKIKVNGCEIYVSTKPKVPGSSLVIVKHENPVIDTIINKPIEITNSVLSNNYDENRELQMQRASEVAVWLADKILAPDFLGHEDAQIMTQDLLQTKLGNLPDGALDTIETILTANLSSVKDVNQRPEYKVKTDNALADVVRTVTQYRTTAFDVNGIANLGDKLVQLPVLNKLPFAKPIPQLFRERFQSALGSINSTISVFTETLAQMRLRHEQMKEARLDLRVLERYLELSQFIGEELDRIVKERLDASEPSETERAVFTKAILNPIGMRNQAILRERAAVMTAYHQFALLMDGNLDLLMMIGNIRRTASLEMKTFGAGTILANEQQTTKNMIRDYYATSDEMRKQLAANIKKNGIQIRELPAMIIESTKQMMDSMDQLMTELDVALNSATSTNEKLTVANKGFRGQLEIMRTKGASYDLAKQLDAITDKLIPKSRRGDQIGEIPDIPELAVPVAN